MNNVIRKDVLITLKWIKSEIHVPQYYQLIFLVEDPKDSYFCRHIYFSFTSFDLMFVYLKNLTRAFGVCFIDKLFDGKYKVTIEYEDIFNSLPVFHKLYLSDNIEWPTSTIQGHFLWCFDD